MKLTKNQRQEIEDRSEQVYLAFDKKGGYDAIARYATLAQRIRVKWWAHHMTEYNKAYWDMIMMMTFFNLGNSIEQSIETVGQSGSIESVSTVLSLEGYDYAVVSKLYENDFVD